MITETLRDSITTESNSKFTLLISSKLPLATTICLTPLPYVLPARVCSIFVYLKSCLKPGCLIIDVSCDEGMGFYFAKPTTFKNPMFKIGMVDYYAVDHTPSYLWESASRSLSAALVVHLPTVLEGADGW